MKKKTALLSAVCVLFTSAGISAAAADGTAAPTEQTSSVITVKLNNGIITFEDGAAPFIDGNGRTQMPLRAVSENLGCSVSWNADEQTAQILRDDFKCVFRIGGNTCSLYTAENGAWIHTTDTYLDTAPVIVNDRTYVPLKALCNPLGIGISYENGNVILTESGTEPEFATALRDLNNFNILAGLSKKSLDPSDKLTRGELAVMIHNLADNPVYPGAEQTKELIGNLGAFEDLPAEDDYCYYLTWLLSWCYKAQYREGSPCYYTSSKAEPQAEVSYDFLSEAISFVLGYDSLVYIRHEVDPAYDISGYPETASAWMSLLGLYDSIDTSQTVTFGDAVKILSRALDVPTAALKYQQTGEPDALGGIPISEYYIPDVNGPSIRESKLAFAAGANN